MLSRMHKSARQNTIYTSSPVAYFPAEPVSNFSRAAPKKKKFLQNQLNKRLMNNTDQGNKIHYIRQQKES